MSATRFQGPRCGIWFHDLKEILQDAQTKLHKSFYNYAQSTGLKLKDSEVSDGNLRERLSVVEQRITELFRKVSWACC